MGFGDLLGFGVFAGLDVGPEVAASEAGGADASTEAADDVEGVGDGDPAATVAAAATPDGDRPDPPNSPKPATRTAMTTTVAAPMRTGDASGPRRPVGPAIGASLRISGDGAALDRLVRHDW